MLSRKISCIFRILATLVELYFGLLVTVENIVHQLKILESYIQECDFSTDPQNSIVFLNKLAKIFSLNIGREIKLIFYMNIKIKVSIMLNFNNVNRFWWMWPGMTKLTKITSLQNVCNILRKKWGITLLFAWRKTSTFSTGYYFSFWW